MPISAQPNMTPADLVVRHLAADETELRARVVALEAETSALRELLHAAVALLHVAHLRRSHRQGRAA